MTNRAHSDRTRRAMRIPVTAIAVVHAVGELTHGYEVDNVSLGGALLRGAPAPQLGWHIQASIRIRGVPHIQVAGHVVRVLVPVQRKTSWAIAFEQLPADAEDLLHDVAVWFLEKRDRPATLIIHSDPEVRRLLSEQLRLQRKHPIIAASPLEAISWLSDADTAIEEVWIDLDLKPCDGRELMAFFARTLPAAHRVVIAATEDEPRVEPLIASGLAHSSLTSRCDSG